MLRWMMVSLTVFAFALSALEAAPTRNKNTAPPLPKIEKKAPIETAKAAEGEAPDQFQMTRDSEVLLNGEPCKIEEVPGSAVITKLEVSPDRRTIVRIHFRSK